MNINKIIHNYIIENYDNNQEMKNILIKRIPFLNDYNIYEHSLNDKRIDAQRIISYKNIKFVTSDSNIILFDNVSISSNVTYYPHIIYDNEFHIFIIENKISFSKPKNFSELDWRVFLIGRSMLNEKLSYHKEYRVKVGEEIPIDDLNKIINDMNKNLFKLEEFTKKHYIDLFNK